MKLDFYLTKDELPSESDAFYVIFHLKGDKQYFHHLVFFDTETSEWQISDFKNIYNFEKVKKEIEVVAWAKLPSLNEKNLDLIFE